MVLGICGAGGSGREVLELAEYINSKQDRWKAIVYIEKDQFQGDTRGRTVYTFEEAKQLYGLKDIEYVISVGEPFLRAQIANQIIESDCNLATLIDPDIRVPQSCLIGAGSVIRGQVFLSTDIELGINTMIQPRAVLGHDVKIGNHSVVSSLCALSGACEVGEKTYLAVNCITKELTHIGSGTIISMGSVVRKSIPDNVIAEGNPAKVICDNRLQEVFGWNIKKG